MYWQRLDFKQIVRDAFDEHIKLARIPGWKKKLASRPEILAALSDPLKHCPKILVIKHEEFCRATWGGVCNCDPEFTAE